MSGMPIVGVTVDLKELKKTSRIILWGRLVRDDFSISPSMRLMEIPVDWGVLPDGLLPIEAHISFE